MAQTNYFIKMGGIIVLGILALLIGMFVMILLTPHMTSAGVSVVISTILFLFIWLVVYIGLVIGAMIVFFFTDKQKSNSPAPARKVAKKAKRRR